MARDCRGRGDPSLQQNNKTQFDSEYTALMAELGEGGGQGPTSAQTVGALPGAPAQSTIPPWRVAENWNTNSKSTHKMGMLLANIGIDFRGVGQAMPHPGFQQPGHQNAGYGYGAAPSSYPAGGAGAADPYAA
jgi:splicing factor 1